MSGYYQILFRLNSTAHINISISSKSISTKTKFLMKINCSSTYHTTLAFLLSTFSPQFYMSFLTPEKFCVIITLTNYTCHK